MQMIPPLWLESKEELTKEPLMRVKEESEKAGLKLNNQKKRSWHLVLPLHHFMANRWGNNGTVIFLGSKSTADSDCSLEIKKRLLLVRKAMASQNSILKSRGINLPTNVCLVNTVVFLIVMYGCESWTIKKAEH